LRSLFSAFDTFFFYDGSKNIPAALKTIWIYPKGSAGDLRPVGPAEWAGAKELEASMTDKDPRVRESVYAVLLERPDQRSREIVIDVLTGAGEPESPVRERLLSNAVRRDFAVPVEILTNLALRDLSERIRWLALDAVSEHESARRIAEAALTDSSEAVRARAQEILAQTPDPERGRQSSENNSAVRP
jgi:HEAT repeat protein